MTTWNFSLVSRLSFYLKGAYRVDIVSKEGSLDSTKHGVQDNTDWQEETSCGSWHASQGVNDGRSASEQHSSDKDVGHQTEANIYTVGNGAITCSDNLEESVSIWSSTLQLDCQGRK
jgi:hypothetical protein